MNTRQMEIFVSIIRYGNFSNAARKLYISQPAVSSNIDLLEKELGTKLLIRQGRRTTLTEKGKIFYDYCIEVLSLTEKTVNLIKEDEGLSGTLHIAASSVPGLYLIPNFIYEFKKIHPEIKFEIDIKNSKIAYDSLLDNKYDMSFVGESSRSEYIMQKKIFEDEMVLITPNIYPYNKMEKEVDIKDLLDMPFILRTFGSSTLNITEKEFNRNGYDILDLNTVATFDSGEAVILGVRQKLGVSIVSSICIKDNKDILQFKIKDTDMKRIFYASILNTNYISPKVCEFYEFLPTI